MTRVVAGKFGAEGRRINVNAVCPGPFRSRMMRSTLEAVGEEALGGAVGRIGEPEDMAAIALLLASRAGECVASRGNRKHQHACAHACTRASTGTRTCTRTCTQEQAGRQAGGKAGRQSGRQPATQRRGCGALSLSRVSHRFLAHSLAPSLHSLAPSLHSRGWVCGLGLRCCRCCRRRRRRRLCMRAPCPAGYPPAAHRPTKIYHGRLHRRRRRVCRAASENEHPPQIVIREARLLRCVCVPARR